VAHTGTPRGEGETYGEEPVRGGEGPFPNKVRGGERPLILLFPRGGGRLRGEDVVLGRREVPRVEAGDISHYATKDQKGLGGEGLLMRQHPGSLFGVGVKKVSGGEKQNQSSTKGWKSRRRRKKRKSNTLPQRPVGTDCKNDLSQF